MPAPTSAKERSKRMSLQGKIESVPLNDLYQWIQATHKTGSLSLNYDGTEKVVFFRLGNIAGANSPSAGLVFTEDEIKAVLDESLRSREGTFKFIEASLPGEFTSTQNNIPMQSPHTLFDQSTGRVNDLTSKAASSPNQSDASPLAQKLRTAVFERVFQGDFKIPLLPTVAQKVLEITRRENFSLRDLGNAILTDQVIAGRVLKLANSGAYGGQQTIDSLPVAVQRLGSQAVANLVLVLSLQSARSGKDIFLPLRQQLWQHASACALFARVVALSSRLDRDLAFLCGLMMDFGKLVLLSLIQEVMASQPNEKKPTIEIVQEIIESYHPKVGSVVSEKWCLPPAVTEAIECHHALGSAKEFRTFAAAASLSDQIITMIENNPQLVAEIEAENLSCAQEAMNFPAVAMLTFDLAQVERIVARAPECIKFAQDTLN